MTVADLLLAAFFITVCMIGAAIFARALVAYLVQRRAARWRGCLDCLELKGELHRTWCPERTRTRPRVEVAFALGDIPWPPDRGSP